MRYTPKSELDHRIAKLQNAMKQHDIDGAVIIQNADLFYFTGTIQRSHLFVPSEGKPLLMVKKSLERAREESPMDNVIGLDSLKEFNAVLQKYGYGQLKTLGFELDVLPASQYIRYQKLVEPARVVDISQLIRIVRMVKSPYEIEILQDIAKLHEEIFSLVKQNIREGISELELTGIVAAVSREKGHSGIMRVRGLNQELFYVHLLSGQNTSPSYFDGSVGGKGVSPAFAQGSGFKLIGRNEPVLLDYSFVFDGYMLDQTRVFCLGKLPEHLAGAHALAVDILREIKKIAKPGVACGELYDAARQMAGDSAYGKHFLGFPEPVAFVGHGIGIELDELPVIAHGFNTPLEEGMVIAIEPKFVFPDGAVGVENTFLVAKDGFENLTVFDEGIIYV
ncbi:Xaa-Pro peptidase family protein [Pelotomaculum terephthalicicum JT]|uniref:M24 family metallopeptidase n=1 Tax=Pelotomaculum TaxID=191373 RepID=UPI0009D12A03|nr:MULTISPECIES: Xaa-Pro peptidase family protein [Pelotomaculum]MCG9968876.1 Xaa-Pro peptidase family protein [Pelotomaculum terephthalicicum JT]OPX87441.1 MAG: Xaa-Pro dipeptidase [Pelotomaculum sp. PtaB.Bin117]OPY61594.1 MAG: Xaa-Pro dipeptidase [Pelotomaculum sp. PtaU1.Bin065]